MADGAKGTTSDVYVLDTGATGAERLRLLDQVYGPFTRQSLKDAGLGPETRALDLACGVGTISCWMASQIGPAGSVVAADVNPDQLVVAKAYWSECDSLQPIDFIEASAYDTGLPANSFDIVHCRLLLCHLTQPRRVLREIYRILKPGGVLVAHELRLSSVWCWPESAAYTRGVAIALEAGQRLGVNYDYGMQLPADAMDAGFQPPETSVVHPGFLSGAKKRIWEHTFAEALPVMVRAGATTESKGLDVLAEMRTFADDDTTFVAQWAHVAVLARK